MSEMRGTRRGRLLFVVPVDSPVDLMFERSENVAIAHVHAHSSGTSMFEQLLLACNEGCGLRDNSSFRLYMRMHILANAN